MGAKNKSKKSDKEDQNGDPKTEEKENKVPELPSINYFQMFRYATKSDLALIFVGIIAALISSALQPLNNLVYGEITGVVISYAMRKIDTDEFLDDVLYYVICMVIIGVLTFFLGYVMIESFSYTGLRQVYKIRSIYLQKLLNQDVGWYDVNQTGDFASRMSDDLTKVEEGLGEKIPIFITLQATFVSSVIMAMVKGWELALICMTSLPVAGIIIGILLFIGSKLSKTEVTAYGAAGAVAEEVLTSIRTVLAFGGQYKEQERYKFNLNQAKRNNIIRSIFNGISFGFLFFCIFASNALAFWYGVGLILEERDKADPTYTPQNMITIFFSVMGASASFGFSSWYFEAFSKAKASTTKIFSVIDSIPTINESKNNGKKLENLKGKITFKNVEFHYPSRSEVPILTGLDLTINPGESVALVGSSGCGKSTCVQLIQRFYDPAFGNIHIDDTDLRDLDLTWFRNQVGVVGQEPVLFGTSIEENIRYGNMEVTKKDIVAAAKRANAHEFISKLPKGYDSLVGERGAQLSGGQKQRIAIARALVKKPVILLLDEATSALDNNSESKVQAALESASKETTTVIVAHRLSTIRGADKIVVVSNGKVVEQGTHHELMAKKSEYYKLVMAQVHDEDKSGDSGYKKMVSFDESRKASIVYDQVEEIEEDQESDDEHTKSSIWSVLRMNGPEWPQILIACITSCINGASMPVFSILLGDVLGTLSYADEDYVRDQTNTYSIYFVAMGAISFVSMFSQNCLFGVAGEKLTYRLRAQMFTAMLRQEIGWYDRKENGVGALCAKLSGEAAHVQGATGQVIGSILQSIMTLGLSIGLSMYYEWKLGLVALAFTPFILVSTYFSQMLMNVENESYHKSMQKSTKVAVEAVSNIRTVVSLGCENTFQNLYLKELLPHHKKTLRNSHVRAAVYALSRSTMYFANAGCLIYGSYLIRDGMDYSILFKVSQALITSSNSAANVLAFSPNIQKGLTAAENATKLLHRIPKIKDSPTPIEKQWQNGNFDFSEVSFEYPTRPNTMVLNSLDLSIMQGKTVALVGPSGCGKSTIIQLVERFYDPASGEVSMDKEDIRNVTLHSLRSQMGIVSQEPILFDRTIGANIAYGDNTRIVDNAEIIEAAKNANIHNFITTLPLGYETSLGEKGTQLSGGQKQRLAIARALVRNPKILLLDEATSALDTESEKVVQEALDQAKKGRTCITIAHRLTTIQDADVICVMNNGKVSEMGTHSELLETKGLYYKLYSLQRQ